MQLKLTPPLKLTHPDWAAHKVGIYVCDTNHKVMIGILWKSQSCPLVFEYVHGTISANANTIEPNELLKICRSQCIGVLVTNGEGMWETYLRQRSSSSARLLILIK